MPYKGFGSSDPTITGFEAFVSISITGEMDQILIEPGAADTAPTVVTYYNPRYTCSIDGISSGVSVPATFTLAGVTWVRTSESYARTTGDVVRVNVQAVHNPSNSS